MRQILPSFNNPQIRNVSGFTLLEVVVALMVMTVGVVAVIAMQTNAITGNAMASRLSGSVNQSAMILEKIVSSGYSVGPYAIPLNIDTTGDGIVDMATSAPIAGGTYAGVAANMAALDRTEGFADFTSSLFPPYGGNYTLSINIARNFPDNNMDTIRVIITSNAGNGNRVGFSTTVTRI